MDDFIMIVAEELTEKLDSSRMSIIADRYVSINGHYQGMEHYLGLSMTESGLIRIVDFWKYDMTMSLYDFDIDRIVQFYFVEKRGKLIVCAECKLCGVDRSKKPNAEDITRRSICSRCAALKPCVGDHKSWDFP